jgi:hypothetical protein
MPYIVVRNDGPTGHSGPEAPRSVLSRVSPDALLSWVDLGVSRATDYRYAITFETLYGALRCAEMQGGEVRRVSGPGGCPHWVTDVGRGDGAACGVGDGGNACGLVEVG